MKYIPIEIIYLFWLYGDIEKFGSVLPKLFLWQHKYIKNPVISFYSYLFESLKSPFFD